MEKKTERIELKFLRSNHLFIIFVISYTHGAWGLGVNVHHIYFMVPTVGALRRGEMTSNNRFIARYFKAPRS